MNVLNDWATDPDASHVAVTPDDAELEDLFADLAANISKPGATNIVIKDSIHTDFSIVSVGQPTKGSAAMIDSQTLEWKIDELGVTGNEGASLDFFVKHTAQTSGVKLVNESVSYTDTEGNSVTFPAPTVEVSCDIQVDPEPCPVPVELTVERCQDSLVADLGSTYLESLGRIVQLDVTVKNVCPGKRVALAVILTETDGQGNEYSRGMKTFTIPAHTYPGCRDIKVKCIKFVLPENLNVSSGSANSICGERNLRARVIAHNIDTDFVCCGTGITI